MDLLPRGQDAEFIETREVLKKLTETRAALAELKGFAATIPNAQILVDTLSLQEAKESSAIENIVTTHDELYRSNFEINRFSSASAKEVFAYAKALKKGFAAVKDKGFISLNIIVKVQEIIERNNAGIRRVPGTKLRNEKTQALVYSPPQEYDEIMEYLKDLEEFMNDEKLFSADPLVKMAMIHHQFESIHPFYDGNGRTGRILNILYLIKEKLLNLPVLYISRYIVLHRSDYYRLLQDKRKTGDWVPWVLYMLEAVEQTSRDTMETVKRMKVLMTEYKQKIRSEEPRIYSQDLINNIFRHPYTKIAYLRDELRVTRQTATRYLDRLTEMKMLEKTKIGRSNYYINMPLFDLLRNPLSESNGIGVGSTLGSDSENPERG